MTTPASSSPSVARGPWITGGTLLAVLAAAPAQAPVTAVVPAAFDRAEAPSTAFWAFSPFTARRQLLIDQRHLAGLQGKRIKALLVRRNGLDDDPLKAGVIRLEVTLSHARTTADLASDSFAENRAATTDVAFNGVVNLPAAPTQRKAPAPWTVRVELRKPFLYSGGTLCIETVSLPVTNRHFAPWWPIDAVVEDSDGQVTPLGSSCIPGMPGQPAGADGSGFVPGSTATLFLQGATSETTALSVIGTSSKLWGTTPLPLDLGPLGAPGCFIHVDMRSVVPVPLTPLPQASLAHASRSMLLPPSAAIVGLSLYSQWALPTNANSFGWATSNGVRATVGAPSPLTGLTWIEATDLQQARGRVLRGRFPVLRLEAFGP